MSSCFFCYDLLQTDAGWWFRPFLWRERVVSHRAKVHLAVCQLHRNRGDSVQSAAVAGFSYYYRSTSASTVRRQLAAPDAALAACWATHQLQVGRADVQDSADVISAVSEQRISLRTSARNTRSSSVPLLCVPFRRTSFARRSFSIAAPLTWNSLPPAVLNCDCLSTFESRLKTHLFSTAFC